MMTLRACICVSMLLAAAAPAGADPSEPVLARDMIPLRVRPAETARSYANVSQGTELEVLSERGRWLRVRHGRRIGWVTRTQVQQPPAKPVARPERTGFSGKHREDAMKVTISIDKVRGFDDPRTKANEVLDLAKGDIVTVIGRGHQGWLLVESTSGDVGWIPGSVVADGATFKDDPRLAPSERVASSATATPTEKTAAKAPTVASTAAEPAPAVSEPIVVHSMSEPREKRMTGSLFATAGVDMFQLREDEAVGRVNGPMGILAVNARMKVKSAFFVGLAGNAGIGGGDLTYYTAAETSKPMATRDIAIDASAEVGWGRTWSVAARGGYHMASFAVDSDRSEPMLVGETFSGATVGLGGSVPIGSRFALSAAVDMMPSGSHSPDDAAAPVATAVRAGWARTMVTVKLPAHLTGAVAYRAGMLDAELPDGKTRSDRSHAVSAGLGMTW